MPRIRNYTVAVYAAEEGGYWAEVLDLPGAVAQAETLPELEHNVRDTIAAWIETRHELDGGALPRPVYTMSVLAEEPDDLVRA